MVWFINPVSGNAEVAAGRFLWGDELARDVFLFGMVNKKLLNQTIALVLPIREAHREYKHNRTMRNGFDGLARAVLSLQPA